MELSTPKKHGSYYHLKIVNHKKPLVLSFFKVNLVQLYPLSRQQGFALVLKLSPTDDTYKELIEMETQIIEQMIQYNSQWFQNELTSEQIHEMFQSSIHQNEFCVYYSYVRTPKSNIQDILKWYQERKYSLPISVQCKIKCDGLFIYPKKFSLRWTLTELNEYEDVIPEELEIDTEQRLSIEDYWKERCQTTLSMYQRKIEAFQILQSNLIQQVSQMEKASSLNQWEMEIEKLKEMIVHPTS